MITIHSTDLVTVDDRLLRRRYGCYRRGALWFSDAGRVSPRIQRAIEAALQEQHARS